MKKLQLFALLSALLIPISSAAQGTCANPAQAGPNFSGSFTLAAGASLPVNWTPSPTAGCTTYYTLDGSAPGPSSPVYTGQTIELTKTTVILMVAQGSGMTPSAQEGGGWNITVTGTPPPPPPPPPTPGKPVALTCTPSTGSTAKTPGTTSLYRATSPSTNFTLLASSLPPACTYTDSTTIANQTYNYYAEAVINGQSSVPSNTSAVLVPPAVATPTTPTVAVFFAPTTIDNGTAVTATITVSGTSAPTGSVTLTSGAFSSAATTLTSGSVTIAIPADSLDVGSLSFTATYTPDTASGANYTSATGTGGLVVTPVAPSAVAGTVIQ